MAASNSDGPCHRSQCLETARLSWCIGSKAESVFTFGFRFHDKQRSLDLGPCGDVMVDRKLPENRLVDERTGVDCSDINGLRLQFLK